MTVSQHYKLKSDVEEMIEKSRAESLTLPKLLVLRSSVTPKTDNVGDDAFDADRLYLDSMRMKKENELKAKSSSSSE